MNSTLAKVYAGIIAIPLAAIMLAGALAGGSDSYDYNDYERDLATMQDSHPGSAAHVTEAEAYSSLGKYNPCIFIACEGE